MKSFLALIGCLFTFSSICLAQDVITTRDKQKIQAIVTEVGDDYIKFKYYHNLEGSVYILKIKDIISIRYQNGQVEAFQTENRKNTKTLSDLDQDSFYFGMGVGLDYGGMGGKFEIFPIKHFGVFAGVGYNLLSVGCNVGVAYKGSPNDDVSTNFVIMYGYNSVLKGTRYDNAISYGLTIGAIIDYKIKNNKLSTGFFIPFRSKVFKERYLDAQNYMNLSPCWPMLFSIGFCVGL